MTARPSAVPLKANKKARHIMDLIRKPTVFISTVRTGSTLCSHAWDLPSSARP